MSGAVAKCVLGLAVVAAATAISAPTCRAQAQAGLQDPAASAQRVETRDESAHTQALPYGVSVQALTAVGSGTVLAGSFGLGIFRSEDGGETWSVANEGLTDPFILSLATAPDGTIYVGTFKAGVFRSQDTGQSWKPISEGFKRLQIKALLITKKAIYAGTGDGVYEYHTRRGRWSPVSTGLEDVLVHCLAMAADGTLYAGTSGKGVMKFKRRGARWTRLTEGLVDHEGLRENFIRVLAIDRDQAIYVGTFDGGVFRSGDGGKTWRAISRALPNDSIRGIVPHEGVLFVATGRGVFKTLDHGVQWVPINKGLTERSIQVLFRSPDGGLYAGTSAGAFRSKNDGEMWVPINQGIEGVSPPPFYMFQ